MWDGEQVGRPGGYALRKPQLRSHPPHPSCVWERKGAGGGGYPGDKGRDLWISSETREITSATNALSPEARSCPRRRAQDRRGALPEPLVPGERRPPSALVSACFATHRSTSNSNTANSRRSSPRRGAPSKTKNRPPMRSTARLSSTPNGVRSTDRSGMIV